MYVISSRTSNPKRVTANGDWAVLFSGNGKPPNDPPLPPSNYLAAGFLNSLVDPLLVVMHGYNNLESEAFSQFANISGLTVSDNSLPAHEFFGTIIGFDWPSLGSHSPALWKQFNLYKHDLDAARGAAVPALESFLDRLTNAVRGRGIRVNLMAHSMGNFVVSRVLTANPGLASRLDNVVSFAPDMLQSDLEQPELVAAADALAGNWFVYWAQADVVLLTASDWANILLGNEQWGGRRLGQEGPPTNGHFSRKVVTQCWDVPLSKQMGSTYNWDLREWPYSTKIHGLYWSNGPFLDNVVANVCRAEGCPPVVVDWAVQARAAS